MALECTKNNIDAFYIALCKKSVSDVEYQGRSKKKKVKSIGVIWYLFYGEQIYKKLIVSNMILMI